MRRWSGVIAREGVQTGDGRVIADGALYWEGLPLPLVWSPTGGGHVDTVPVGTVDVIERRDGGEIWAEGGIDDEGGHGAEAVRLMGEGLLRGVSIEPDDWQVVVVDTRMTEADLAEAEAELLGMVAAAGDPDPGPDAGVVVFEDDAGAVVERLVRGRVRGLALLPDSAFIDAEIHLIPAPDGDSSDEDSAEALTAAVIGSTDLPVADRDTTWDGAAAARRVFDMCTDGDSVDVDCVSRAFLWRDPDGNPDTQAAYSLGFADVVNDRLQIVPAGVAATAGGRGVDAADIPAEDKTRIRARICALYDTIRDRFEDWPDCPFNEDAATTAASGCGCGGSCDGCPATVTAAGFNPPAEWFQQPDLNEPTPLTVTEDGRVFGHVARHDTCHTGLAGCVTAPRSARGYTDFHRYSHTVSGRELPVTAGRITGGHGQYADACRCCPGNDDHACKHLSLQAAVGFHDQLSTLAYVRVGEDEANNAIWMAGVVAPEATDRDRALLSRRMVSGDWRSIAGGFELVEVLALARERPGFPVALVAAGGRPVSLTGAGAISPRPEQAVSVVPGVDEQVLRRVAAEAAEQVLTAAETRAKEHAAAARAREALKQPLRDALRTG